MRLSGILMGFKIWAMGNWKRANGMVFLPFAFCLSPFALLVFMALFCNPALAADYTQDLEDFITAELKPWINSDIVLDNLRLQNEASVDISESNLMVMDNNWRSEFRKVNQPLIGQVLNSELSAFLKKKLEEGQGVYTQIAIINNKGLNIAQTVVSDHYWNIGQPRWDKTFRQGSYATYISDLYYSDETSKFQVEISFMIIADDQPVGILAAGIDVEQLEDWKKRRQ